MLAGALPSTVRRRWHPRSRDCRLSDRFPATSPHRSARSSADASRSIAGPTSPRTRSPTRSTRSPPTKTCRWQRPRPPGDASAHRDTRAGEGSARSRPATRPTGKRPSQSDDAPRGHSQSSAPRSSRRPATAGIWRCATSSTRKRRWQWCRRCHPQIASAGTSTRRATAMRTTTKSAAQSTAIPDLLVHRALQLRHLGGFEVGSGW